MSTRLFTVIFITAILVIDSVRALGGGGGSAPSADASSFEITVSDMSAASHLNNDNSNSNSNSNNIQRVRNLMVNGVDTKPYEFSFHVQIGCCSGALISNDVVITASHDVPSDPTGMIVTVGAYWTDNTETSTSTTSTTTTNEDENEGRHPIGVQRTIIKAYRHPQSDNMHYDFTILLLDRPVDDDDDDDNGNNSNSNDTHTTTKRMIRPIRINRSSDFPTSHQRVILLGTGTTSLEGTERPDVLQQATSRYIPNDECSQSFDESRGIKYDGSFLDETSLCTHGIDSIDSDGDDNGDGCVFDSGGPVIASRQRTSATSDKSSHDVDDNDGDKSENVDDFVLIGLISFGVDCADPVYPAVNARVSAVSDWIDGIVCEHSTNPPADFPCNSSNLSTEKREKVALPSHLMTVATVFWLVALGAVIVCGIFLVILWKRRKNRCQEDATVQAGEHQPLLLR